jgi:cytochrome c oxidase subunit 3
MRAVSASRSNAGLVRQTLSLVLSIETVLFGTLIMAYLFLRTGGSTIPFVHPTSSDLWISAGNTMILLLSAVFVWMSQRAIAANDDRRLQTYLSMTFFLGAVFIAGQIFEFNHSGMHVDDSAFGGVFFALISFHASHVLAGMTILGLNTVRARLGDFNSHQHDAIIVGTWFWYYVIAVWLILFFVLYVV